LAVRSNLSPTPTLGERDEDDIEFYREMQLTQHVILVEWAIYKSALMLDYHGIDFRDARAVVELAKLLIHRK